MAEACFGATWLSLTAPRPLTPVSSIDLSATVHLGVISPALRLWTRRTANDNANYYFCRLAYGYHTRRRARTAIPLAISVARVAFEKAVCRGPSIHVHKGEQPRAKHSPKPLHDRKFFRAAAIFLTIPCGTVSYCIARKLPPPLASRRIVPIFQQFSNASLLKISQEGSLLFFF